ncbi:MAG: NAD-dependent malic enzyme [Acidimicrobiia bacterium]|nr:NAD-dependent malic enzyme [Acidimicrobiia bacterium]
MKYRIERSSDGEWIIADVWKRGHAVLQDGLLNKGSAFAPEERELFDLDGMLPFQHTDRPTQVQRAYEHIQAKGDNPLEKYVGLAALQDRNETLFYQVLSEHVSEMIPIVYTPTVGEAALRFSHLFRKGRGLWITPDHRGRIFDVLGHARNEEVRLIVVTDNERILGLGDQGAGGMVIPIGKLALYTLGAGIHPAYTLPISLDVGTDNQALLNDPLYVGWRQPRLRGAEYDALIDEFVEAVKRRFPGAILQWEDFKKANAFRLLDRYRTALPSFNDDIQGTAAVVVAGILSSCRATGTKLEDQRVLLVGAGAAGVGVARHLRHEFEALGMDDLSIFKALALVDTVGLVVDTRADLEAHKRGMAWPADLANELGVGNGDRTLAQIVDRLRPTVLVGTTGQPGVFDEEVIRAMAAHVDRPIVMALSNPTSKCEAAPEDVVEWSGGAAVLATGSPFDPVEHVGRLIPVSQCNNVYVFPGVGLGAMVGEAKVVTDEMFAVAARTLAGLLSEEDLAAGRLYPPIDQLRPISRAIAEAVARVASSSGVGRHRSDGELVEALDHEVWDLDYPKLMPV